MRKDFYSTYFELESRHWWFLGRRKIFLDLLAERLPEESELAVLDFGCGAGALLEDLERFGTVSAVDADKDAVRFCHQRGRTEVRHVPVGARLPFEDGSFDLVTTLDVIEHISDDVAALVELRRVMRRRALLLVAVPAYPFLWGDQDVISHHHRRYTARTLREVLMEAGFALDHSSYFNTLLFPPIAIVRLARRLRRRPPPPNKSDLELGPEWANGALARVFASESGLVRRPGMPFGVSILAVARPA